MERPSPAVEPAFDEKKMVTFVKVVGLRGSGWSIGWSKENDGKHAAPLSLILELSPMAIKERRF